MNREIKCRVYSKRLKAYIDYHTIGFSMSGELQYISDKHGAGPAFAGDYIVEQFTGFKDKNGKEVYEGDLVKWEMDTFEVRWYEGNGRFLFAYNLDMECHLVFNTRILHEIEVVGNIHGEEEEK